MEHYPKMNIHFPPDRESDLHADMKARATSPWSPQEHDVFGRPPKEGHFYFHRDEVSGEPSCTLCIGRVKPGHWVVEAIVPDEGQVAEIPIATYKALLKEFENTIAEPAAEAVKGLSSIEISEYRLEDYFSPRAVGLLDTFCNSSNGLGSHPSDQRKWIDFLLAAFDDGADVHCDVFGSCLKSAGWWPEQDVGDLAHEYDFAMRLLKQSGR